ncbi:hypothetical protein FRC03_004053 [Tulasnella sp. 419]|nr:hypothetical protein FRC03_004053 [Tulasnella sp. 419]
MDGISWSDFIKATFCSCTSCGISRAHSTDDLGDLESQSRTQPQSWRANHEARDELEGLLASSDNDDIDTLSLHSNVGRKKKKNKKRKRGWGITGRQKSSKPKIVQLFGWYPFGRPTQGEIALSSSEDEDDGPSTSRTLASTSRPTSASTFENLSDASPLDSATIARLASSQWNADDDDFADQVEDEVQRLSPRPVKPPTPISGSSSPVVESTPVSPMSPQPEAQSSNSPATLSAEDARAAEQAKVLKRAMREQRKRLKEERARRAQEEEERRAELAAGGFYVDVSHVHETDDFGSFIDGTNGYGPEGMATFGQARTTPTLTGGTSQASSNSVDDADDEDADHADYGAEYAVKRRNSTRDGLTGGSGSVGTSERSKSVSNGGKPITTSRPTSISSLGQAVNSGRLHNLPSHPNPLIRPNMVPLPPSSIGSGPGSDSGRKGNAAMLHQRQDSRSSSRPPTYGHSKSNSRSSFRKTHKPLGSQGSFSSLTSGLQPTLPASRNMILNQTSPLSQSEAEVFDGVVGGFDSGVPQEGFDGVPGGDFSLEDVQQAMKSLGTQVYDHTFDEGFDGVPGGGFGNAFDSSQPPDYIPSPHLDSGNDFPSTGLSRTTFGRSTTGR